MPKEEDVLTLTVDAIRDFQVCELFYHYRYEDGIHETILRRELLAERFENTLKKVASYFFYKKQSGVIPSYSALLSRWEKLWFPKDTTAYDIAVEQHEVAHGNIASYSNVATAALEKFHDDFALDQSDPILIDEPYLIQVAPGIRLDGRIDMILRSEDRYQVIQWSGRQRRPQKHSLVVDFAALRLAFEHRNSTQKQVEFCLYDMASGKSGFIDIDQPTPTDVDALLYWAFKINDTDSYVPRRGFTAYCKGCPFDEPCAEFNKWPKKVENV